MKDKLSDADFDPMKKIESLEVIAKHLSNLDISSAYYPDKESFKNFQQAYYDLVKNVHGFLKSNLLVKHNEELHAKYKELNDEFENKFSFFKKIIGDTS